MATSTRPSARLTAYVSRPVVGTRSYSIFADASTAVSPQADQEVCRTIQKALVDAGLVNVLVTPIGVVPG